MFLHIQIAVLNLRRFHRLHINKLYHLVRPLNVWQLQTHRYPLHLASLLAQRYSPRFIGSYLRMAANASLRGTPPKAGVDVMI